MHFHVIQLNIHILLRVDKLDILQTAAVFVKPVHSIYTLVHTLASWFYCLIHFLGWHEFYESLSSHRSIHSLKLADGTRCRHRCLKTDVAPHLLGA